jgi:AAA family ATP:ADP antiporter
MTTAVVMLGHQVASKAFRDAAFLAVWPAEALPLMVIAATAPVVAVVPVFARLLERFGPRVVVTTGFLISAALHVLEWQLSAQQRWVAVLVYLHVAGLGALLLSGFWSMVSERFEPRTARQSFGRIAAAGTIGGALGGLAAERIAVMPLPVDTMLLLLAALHVLCAAGVGWLGRAPVLLPGTDDAPSDRVFAFQALRESPHIRTIALMMVLATAGAGVLDYLLKWRAFEEFQTGPGLLRFFAVFYGVIQVASFFAQGSAARVVDRFGIGRAMSSLPAGVGLSSIIALLFQVFPIIAVTRGIDAVLRGSFFRSGYELLFVPMDAAERRRMKTFLDVTCDRAGETLGALLVQLLLFTSERFLIGELLGLVIALAGGALWVGRRLDRLYLGVVEQQLVKHAELTPTILGSESGWTVLDLPAPAPPAETRTHAAVVMAPPRKDDPRVRILAELRSGDRARVEATLRGLTKPDRTQVAQVIDLLAWDDLVGTARLVLERAAPSHIGLLVDVLLDPATDFAVRRRIPRILGTLTSRRALDGLLRALDDTRFEVRYQCSRAIDRMLARDNTLTVDPGKMLAHVERELSVPLQVWEGHRLIDQPDRDDDPAAQDDPTDLRHRNLEHVFSMLATVLPREPLQVALRGIRSSNSGLRGLALEYLESVLPPPILARLWQVVDVPVHETASRTSPEHALEQLRASAEIPVVDVDEKD